MVEDLVLSRLQSVELPGGLVGILVYVNNVVLGVVGEAHLRIEDFEVDVRVECAGLSVCIPLNDLAQIGKAWVNFDRCPVIRQVHVCVCKFAILLDELCILEERKGRHLVQRRIAIGL